MSLMSALQQSNQQELNLHLESGRNPDRSSEAIIAAHLSESPTGQDRLMESILERENMNRAYQQVVSNKGAAGVDGMTVGQLRIYLGFLKEGFGFSRSSLEERGITTRTTDEPAHKRINSANPPLSALRPSATAWPYLARCRHF